MTADRVEVRKLDALCRAVVFRRDGHKCLRCGKRDRLQWCHVYSRRYRSLRWDIRNSMTLCSGCHLWWHHRPADAITWWRGLWPDQCRQFELSARARSTGAKRIDLEATRLYLEAQC